jgi:hypothetical protein
VSFIQIDLPDETPKGLRGNLLRLRDAVGEWWWFFRYRHGMLTAKELRDMEFGGEAE